MGKKPHDGSDSVGSVRLSRADSIPSHIQGYGRMKLSTAVPIAGEVNKNHTRHRCAPTEGGGERRDPTPFLTVAETLCVSRRLSRFLPPWFRLLRS